MTSLRASTSLLYTMASPAGVPALLTSRHSKYQSFISYGFSPRSTSPFDFSPQQVPVVRMIVASLVRVPAYYCDLPLCEFQSFNPTSRCASSSLSIRPLAVQVPYDLSLCKFQSLSLSLPQEYSVRRLYYWPLSQELCQRSAVWQSS